MATPNRPLAQNKYSEQYMGNTSFDEDFGVNTVEPLGFDGVNLQRMLGDSLAMKFTESGTVTYICRAAPGTTQATAKWQVFKIDDTTSTIISFADGNANFDNVATDLTSLTYS